MKIANSSKIMFLESEINRLENELKSKKKMLNEIRIVEWINKNYSKFEELLQISEFQMICELINAHILFKLYDQNSTIAENYFLEKIGMMMGCMEDEVLMHFSELIALYEDYDEYMEVDAISEKLNFFRDNMENIENDDFEFISLHL